MSVDEAWVARILLQGNDGCPQVVFYQHCSGDN